MASGRRKGSACPCSAKSCIQQLLIAMLFFMIYVEYNMVKTVNREYQMNTDETAAATAGATPQHRYIESSDIPSHYDSHIIARKSTKPAKKTEVSKFVERGKAGPIQHDTSNLCLHPLGGGMNVQEGNKVVLFEGCFGEIRLMYKWSEKDEIIHTLSDMCLAPVTPEIDAEIILTKNCRSSRFELLKNGEIKHKSTGLCLHVNGGSRSPQKGAGLVLHKECGLERNRFILITQEPINLPKPGLPAPRIASEKPKRVALSILITKDPGPTGGFIDSAAALVQSVINAKSKYNIELVAIVSKEVQECRYGLERMGFRVLERDLPLTPDEIRNPQIAREIVTDGCCGIWELLKLHAWRLTEYDRVLQLDTDIMFHRNFDELFEYDTTLVWTHGALGGSEKLNGGFLVVRPNVKHYEEMVEIIKSGDFRAGRGWRGKCCWVYGGRTIQGILPYYYLYEQVEYQFEVDRCKYNNMVEIDRCKTWKYENVTSNHFTVCQKPFHCRRTSNLLCKAFSEAWWERSHEVEKALGLPRRKQCRGGYEPIDWPSVPEDKVLYPPSP